MLGLAACAVPETQIPATQAPPTQPPVSQATPQDSLKTEIVLNMVDKLNSGDFEGSLAYFADDAMVYLAGLPPTGIEVYNGKDQIRALWEDSVNNHFKWEVKVESAWSDFVNIRAKTWHDFTSQLGVAPLEYIDIYEIKGGKITTYGSTITEEALARFKPAFAEVVPPDPTVTPPTDPPVSEFAVTIADGTCTTDRPTRLKAGEVIVTLDVKDQDKSLYALTVFSLDPGKDLLDLMSSTTGAPPSWGDMLLIEELGPGMSGTYTFSLEKGPVYLICWSKPPDLPIGNAGPIAVVP